MDTLTPTRVAAPPEAADSARPARPVVLIVSKDAESLGGVANYYRLFFARFDSTHFAAERFDIGSRARDNFHRTRRPVGYLLDYARDLRRLRRTLRHRPEIAIVQVSPSLRPLSLARDAGVVLLAKSSGRKVVVFFRGWRDDLAQQLGRAPLRRALFRAAYLRADRFIVLAERFVPAALAWGIEREHIRVSRTMFDGSLVAAKPDRGGQPARFVFLSRIALSKGVFDLLEAAARLRDRGHRFTIDFYGFGDVQENMPDARRRFDAKVAALGLQGICLPHEFIRSGEKYRVLAEADVFVLPTYAEGCPNSVIEALASGTFVISTPVGAIPELYRDGEHGLFHQPGDVEQLADRMASAIADIEAIRARANAIRAHAFEHFEAAKLIAGVLDVYRGLADDRG